MQHSISQDDTSSFLLTGLLFIACAVAMRQVLRGSRGNPGAFASLW
jgi:hypothetical protein